jgi:Helix-turn-helix domain
MLERKRTRLSLTEKNDIWGRWKAGQSMQAIGRAYGRPHPTIRKLLLPRGGIAPLARRRSRLALTLAEREDISRGIASGSSIREIARGLSRATSLHLDTKCGLLSPPRHAALRLAMLRTMAA